MNTAVHFSSASDDWETPQAFFDALNVEFGFTLDVCATEKNTKCTCWISRDSLAHDWSTRTDGVLWMNPPYGRGIGAWVSKARRTAELGPTVVCLLPARTDTAWWHDHVIGGGAEIRFVRGRLKFGGSKNSAPFPSAVVIFSAATVAHTAARNEPSGQLTTGEPADPRLAPVEHANIDGDPGAARVRAAHGDAVQALPNGARAVDTGAASPDEAGSALSNRRLKRAAARQPVAEGAADVEAPVAQRGGNGSTATADRHQQEPSHPAHVTTPEASRQ